MREKLMNLMGWCWELNKRTKYETFINYSGAIYDDITVGYYDTPQRCGERISNYILQCEKLTEERLDYAIERLKELLKEKEVRK